MHLRTIIPAFLTPFLSYLAPTLPLIGICTAMVAADCLTAWRLSRRVARTRPGAPDAGKFSSHKFGRTITALIKIYASLLLAHGVDTAIFDSRPLFFGLTVTKLVAAAVVLWQLLSILENEASYSDNRWAAPLRRHLIDKTTRHLR